MVSAELLQVACDISIPVAAGSLTAYAVLFIGARVAKLFQSFNDPK